MDVAAETLIIPTRIREIVLLNPDSSGQPEQLYLVHGLVLEKKRWRDNFYITVTDGVERIDIVLPKKDSPGSISPSDRVEVIGTYGAYGKENTKCINARKFSVTVKDSEIPLDQVDYRAHISAMVDVAEIISQLADRLFVRNGFEEIECNYISTSIAPDDLDPLRIVFTGRGCPLHLEVSPLPQMIYASLMGGIPRLFARSRLFTRAHRDGFTSPESQVLAGIVCSTNENRDADWFGKLGLQLCSWLSEQSKTQACKDPPPTVRITDWPDDQYNENPHVREPTIVIRTIPKESLNTRYAYSAIEAMELIVPDGFAIIEGQSGFIGKSIRYEWFTIHVERLRRLLGAYEHWRIRHNKKVATRSQA